MALQCLNIKKVWNEELRNEEISINHLLCDADLDAQTFTMNAWSWHGPISAVASTKLEYPCF